MLTRLRVRGFKNLTDVEVRFGPFTCIAGANGVGKSNLLDAISFLSALSDKPLIDAALCVRDEGGRAGDVRSLFHRVGTEYAREMSFEAEMIVPKNGFDDLGQPATSTTTLLRYSLTLRYRADEVYHSCWRIGNRQRRVTHIKRREASKHLLFPNSMQWRRSVLNWQAKRTFYSLDGD